MSRWTTSSTLLLTVTALSILLPKTYALSSDARDTCTKVHNGYRSQVASGQVLNGPKGRPLPAGKGIYELTVDPDIEQTAQAWANRCQFVHSHTPGLGENIYYYTEQLPEARAIADACTMWWNELAQFGVQSLTFSQQLMGIGVGHWTQMCWAKTTRVGCGVSWCPDKGFTLVVCNYAPQGNILNQPIYETAGSGCQADQDCTTYPESSCNRSAQLCHTNAKPQTPGNVHPLASSSSG